LGPTLASPEGDPAAGTAALWGLAQRCALTYAESIRRAGIGEDGSPLGEALFDAILASPHGVTFTVDDYDETMRRLETPDGKVSLVIPTLLAELATLSEGIPDVIDSDFPLVLSAGERRSSTANTIQRDPGWRKKDQQGALRVSLDDAARLGLNDGDRARITTKRGTAVAAVEVTDTLLAGHITLPNGFGLGPGGSSDAVGVAPNELTASDDRDWFAGTPHHKHVRARLEKVGT
jgi:anaerobic selenocysteine-containing dehydrogenase